VRRARTIGGMAQLRRARLFDGLRRPRGRSGHERRNIRGGGAATADKPSLTVEYVPPVRPLRPEPGRAIVAARASLGLSVDDVVDRLLVSLGLQENMRERVRAAYWELERDALSPAGVHDSVWNALRDILRVDARRLAADQPARPTAHEPDAVDLLFRGRARG
jgi:hypothetical protein